MSQVFCFSLWDASPSQHNSQLRSPYKHNHRIFLGLVTSSTAALTKTWKVSVAHVLVFFFEWIGCFMIWRLIRETFFPYPSCSSGKEMGNCWFTCWCWITFNVQLFTWTSRTLQLDSLIFPIYIYCTIYENHNIISRYKKAITICKIYILN